MAKKKIRYPLPETWEVWMDATYLLLCAYTLEKNPSSIKDHETRLMLSTVHQSMTNLRKQVSILSDWKLQVFLQERLTKVYKQVVAGQIDTKNKDLYRSNICSTSEGYWQNILDPQRPWSIPNYFLISKKQIQTVGENGASNCAAKNIAKYFKSSSSSIFKYKDDIKKGLISGYKFREQGLKEDVDFCRQVMLKCFPLFPDEIEKMIKTLKH